MLVIYVFLFVSVCVCVFACVYVHSSLLNPSHHGQASSNTTSRKKK